MGCSRITGRGLPEGGRSRVQLLELCVGGEGAGNRICDAEALRELEVVTD